MRKDAPRNEEGRTLGKSKYGKSRGLLGALLVIGAVFAFAGTASAGHYHNNCVDHGLVHGSSTTDGSWHARVEGGCGNPGLKSCLVKSSSGTTYYASYIGTGNSATCNQWSNYCCNEQTGYANVGFSAVFSTHNHFAH